MEQKEYMIIKNEITQNDKNKNTQLLKIILFKNQIN